MLTTLVAIAGIASGVIPIGGIVLYGLGVLHPLSTKATWSRRRCRPDEKKSDEFAALVVRIQLKNRKKSAQTLNNLALIEDPGWPRRIRANRNEPDIVQFNEWQGDDPGNALELQGGDTRTVSAVRYGDSIAGLTDAAAIAKALAAIALPFGDRTRLLIQMSDRSFFAKLVPDTVSVVPLAPKPNGGQPAEPAAGGDDAAKKAADAADRADEDHPSSGGQ